MNANNRNRIIGFDIARAASILIVVLYHSLGYGCAYYYSYVIKTIGFASLAIFTFLSGFLLASRIDLQSCSFMDFMKRRLLRIWPLFFISSVILCLMGYNNWFPTVKAWFGLSCLWRPAPRTIWYVGMLIFLYANTLFWAKGGIIKQILKFMVTMGIVASIQLVFHVVDVRTFYYAPVYFLGIVFGQYYYQQFFSFITTPKLVVLLLVLFLAILIVQMKSHRILLLWGNTYVGMVALMSMYVYLGEKWKDNKRLVSTVSMLSYASFCIYLFHRQVFAFLLMIWRPACQYQLVPYLAILGLAIVIPLAYYIQMGYDRIIKKS